MSLLEVTGAVITAQSGQLLTSSGLLTAKLHLKSLSPGLQGRCQTPDQIIQNSTEQAGRALISAAEAEAASVTEVALEGVALHLVAALAEAGAISMVQVLKISTRFADIMLSCATHTTGHVVVN